VAQRTGAERFLASPAKTASAGLCLVLAVVALLLAGCGGGSSDPGDASTTAGQASGTAPAGGSSDSPGSSESQGSSGSPGGSKATSAAQAAEQAAAGNAGTPGTTPTAGGGGKHGPHITPPKGPREPAPTPAEKAEATVADMSLQSPAIPTGEGGIGALPATYTCDGANSWPALQWSGVPAGTKELILYVMNAQPVAGRLFFDWAVAGLDPGSSSIEAGRLPKGAVVGTNSFGQRGYSACPPAGSGETYIFALFALPKSLAPQKGFDPRPLREEILGVSRDVGLLTAAYARE
jgi:phosphatidylethanolamine-binding protein (PEBP) family uncharacterized protein